MRLLGLVFAVMLSCAACANAAVKKEDKAYKPYKKNPAKHAVLVMDADTEKVLYHENGYDKRYPASLTKMMTLYMVFDAMRQGKISKKTTMKASAKAAKQPQTNIGMRRGYKISVDQGIKALVVRSANDVAVVFAEKLGGSTNKFAAMMNDKARSLGMRHTNFRNPHGLPDSRQVTTARDMAILGIALRRDFPQYYHYFNTTKFSYRKKNFKSHNRVLKDYAHVDGIKTGYIRSSGFNLVSSARKDGFDIVSVVMGGESSKARDGYMKETLDRTFATLRKQKNRTRVIARAPKPFSNPRRSAIKLAKLDLEINKIPDLSTPAKTSTSAARKTSPSVKSAAALTPVLKPKNRPAPSDKSASNNPKAKANTSVASTRKAPSLDVSFDIASLSHSSTEKSKSSNRIASSGNKITAQKPKAKVTVKSVVSRKNKPKAKKGTLDYQLAKLNQNKSKKSTNSRSVSRQASSAPANYPKEWGIQVGAFSDKKTAKKALSNAFKLVRHDARGAEVDIDIQDGRDSTIHRARLANLSRKQAHNICRKLQSMDQACFPLRVN